MKRTRMRNMLALAFSFFLLQVLRVTHVVADEPSALPDRLEAIRADSARPDEQADSEADDGALSEFERDLRFQGYFFGGPAWMSNVGTNVFEVGGGFDYLFYGGLGVGIEGSLLADQFSGIATLGVNGSYHFLPDSPGIEPFVVGGMSFGGAAEYGLDGYTWATAGGGFNYWFANGMALRVEARGRFDVVDDAHAVSLRVGLTF